MRIAHFIFSLYLACIAMYPCSDADSCADEKKTGREVANVADHDHDAGETDLCSPLCICACCASHIRLEESCPVVLKGLAAHHTMMLTLYIEKPVMEGNGSIWQPPKL